MIGMIYEAYHTRNMKELGGLAAAECRGGHRF